MSNGARGNCSYIRILSHKCMLWLIRYICFLNVKNNDGTYKNPLMCHKTINDRKPFLPTLSRRQAAPDKLDATADDDV